MALLSGPGRIPFFLLLLLACVCFFLAQAIELDKEHSSVLAGAAATAATAAK